MITVYPLIQYIVRFQLLVFFYGSQEYRFGTVLAHNMMQTALGVLIAIVYPNIGDIIRYVGAFCGLAYVFTLPVLIQLAIMRSRNELTRAKTFLFYALIVFGAVNLGAQFAI